MAVLAGLGSGGRWMVWVLHREGGHVTLSQVGGRAGFLMAPQAGSFG